MMSNRKAEIERKKLQIEAMRTARQKRQKEKAVQESEESPGKTGQTVEDLRAEAEKLFSLTGIPTNSADSFSSYVTAFEPSIDSTPERPLTGQKKPNLTTGNVQQTNIPPKEQIMYDRMAQTAPLTNEHEGDDDDGEASSPQVCIHGRTSGMRHVTMVKSTQASIEFQKPEEKVPKLKELTNEEKQQILLSQNFQSFFKRASCVTERTLSENVDVFVDYSGLDGNHKEGDKTGLKLSSNRSFCDDRWSKNRVVTCLDWSTQYPELLIASYGNNEDSSHDPDGVALVWNMKFKKSTPEYIFHCQSSVLSVAFAKFHPNLIIGGTYSGQIVLWDNRSNRKTPIQRTPLSAAAHTQPVYCMKVIGTQNAHNLISISTDGKLCTWSVDRLFTPTDVMELSKPPRSGKEPKTVSPTCLSFPPGDVNNFIIGSEECAVYTACRHGAQAGIYHIFKEHQGPVTGIDIHDAQGQFDISHLFLTSSFDWTVKLWSLREKRVLYSFEDYGDYVYDVKWSPIHPSLFASVDGTGKLGLWNLNNDTEAPTASVTIDGSALNKVAWSQSGRQVIAGDDIGRVWTYDVGELAVPQDDEWSELVHTLQELKYNEDKI